MSGAVAIIDYGMGNLHSIRRKCTLLRKECLVTSNPAEITGCSHIILPGVGHFAAAMKNLERLGLVEVLNEEILAKKKPVLGICLGFQLMAQKSEEGNATGLAWLSGDVVRFDIKDKLKYKIPHTGWNQVRNQKTSRLMNDLPDMTEFYFVHAYHYRTTETSEVLHTTEYEYSFVSAVEKENIFGVQYHPEKSHDQGIKLLSNFFKI